ncbi:MAG: dTDP-4-dehydrorhamnose 3,5-epimerase [Chloroflexi bacterium]|nr:dTDP-4-dehydrorhamnose 3,5-epimerase [Chloroflexota bacterium]
MIFTETGLKDAFVVELKKIEDERGFFARAWCQREFEERGITLNWAQANLAHSKKRGTLRGMHFQIAPHEEAKLMRCVRGAMFDVIVDLRPASSTFEQWFGVELTAENRKALYVPPGFAHGYQILMDDTEVFYPVSEFYSPGYERGYRWNDPAFDIEWPITENLIISAKDQVWPDYDREQVGR